MALKYLSRDALHRLLAITVVALALPATASVSFGSQLPDPTEQMIPTMDCDTAACRDARDAVSDHEYARAGELLSAHAEEASAHGDFDATWLIYAARAYEQGQYWDEAAAAYARAAEEHEALSGYLLSRAVRSSLEGEVDEQLLARAVDQGVLSDGPDSTHLLRPRVEAHIDGLPSPESIEDAIAVVEDDDQFCSWLIDLFEEHAEQLERPHYDQAYGFCIDDGHTRRLTQLDVEPSPTARLQRGDQLAAAVEYEDSLRELRNINDDELSEVQRCRRDFRRGRNKVRLRRHTSAGELFRGIVANCNDAANEDQRVRSLYALGRRHYQRGHLDDAEYFYEKLYEDYPYRSHADDALFFLARIERQRNDHDRQREIDLLIEALENYPHEDMVHEMVWEVFEPTFRAGEYREFIDAVTRLPLPDRDEEYFSQGRLEYFVGLAHQRLDEIDEAARYWQRAWVKYPFSFYGYLAHLRLVEHNHRPAAIQNDDPVVDLGWFDDEFETTPTAVLAGAGDLEGACEFEQARLADVDTTRDERWRMATLCHRAGKHPTSHNIARHQISGRPWALPARGRLARWHVAWPDPYGDELQAAVDEFGPGNEALHPGLASAIMREESAFHEDIVSWAGAVGLMQLMPATARMHDDVIDGEATPERLKRAEVNIPIGIDHLTELSNSLQAHPVLMVAAYNAGAGRIRGWLRRQPNDEIALWVEDIPILQTRDYTKRVIGSYAAYQLLQGAEELDDRIAAPAQ